jgi:hypothetical protein
MSLIENYAAERRARLIRLGAIPTNRIASRLTEAQIVPLKPAQQIFVPSVDHFYPSMWFGDLVFGETKLPATIKNIQTLVSDKYGVSIPEIVSARRDKSVIVPRHVAFYLVKKLTTYSYPVIGRYFGGRDHSTIIHAVQKIEARMESEPDLRRDVLSLRERFE